MKTILVTAIGGDLAQSICRCIKDTFPYIRILGSDINKNNSGNIFVENVFILPRANHPNYLKELNLLLISEKIDLVIPSSEQEMEIFYEIGIKNLKPKILGVYENIWKIGHDKYETIKFLKKNAIDHPQTFLLSKLNKKELIELLSIKKVLILKPRFGSGSKSVHKITCLQDIPQTIFQKSNLWIIQEYIPFEDGEFTIAVSRIFNRLKVLQLRRKLFGGSTGYAVVVKNHYIETYVREICSVLKGDFAFNIQLRLKESSPLAFEINPRFSSTVYARHLLGFPDMALWISHSLGIDKKIIFNTEIGDYFQRYFSYKINKKKIN